MIQISNRKILKNNKNQTIRYEIQTITLLFYTVLVQKEIEKQGKIFKINYYFGGDEFVDGDFQRT
jgi:hypothetical protein